MCSVCNNLPCLRRCPNESEPQPVDYCKHCKHGIFEGEKYRDFGYELLLCEECLRKMKASKLADMLGVKVKELKHGLSVTCEWCETKIHTDEKFRDFEYELLLHEECLEETDADDLADLIGIEAQTAEFEPDY